MALIQLARLRNGDAGSEILLMDDRQRLVGYSGIAAELQHQMRIVTQTEPSHESSQVDVIADRLDVGQACALDNAKRAGRQSRAQGYTELK